MVDFFKEWLDPQGAFNQLSLVWLGGWSTVAVILTLLTVCVTLGLAWHSNARLSPKRRWTLLCTNADGIHTVPAVHQCDTDRRCR